MALSLLRGLDRRHFDSSLVTFTRSADVMAREFHALGIPIALCEWDGRRPWRFVQKLSGLVRRTKPDIVLCYSFSVIHAWVHLAAWLGGTRLRVTRVGSWPADQTLWWKQRWVNCLGRPFCTLEIASSYHLTNMLKRVGGYPESRIKTIPLGCDVDGIQQKAAAARAPEIRSRAPRAVMVARMDGAKDQDTLIRAMALLREDVPAARLTLVGDGPRRPLLQRLAREAGAGEAVEFLGTQPYSEIPALLGQADVFVLSTHYEGLPVSLLEAMAAGLPTVASDIAPCREVLDNGEAGMLVPPGDAATMAHVMSRLFSDPGARQSVATAGFRRVSDHYRVDRMMRDYEAVLGGLR